MIEFIGQNPNNRRTWQIDVSKYLFFKPNIQGLKHKKSWITFASADHISYIGFGHVLTQEYTQDSTRYVYYLNFTGEKTETDELNLYT